MATLELYLIRHGLAAERGEHYPDDSKRPLTNEGISRLKREAKGLAALEVSFDEIITSPLVRARQTADVFAEAMKPKPAVSLADALTPAGRPADVVQALATHTKKARLALVGHEPNMGALAAFLIGAKTPVPFKKGAVCRIDFGGVPSRGRGQIVWFATPRMLRELA